MKRTTWITGAALLLGLVSGSAAEVAFDVDGAVPGKWTMDLDAATKLAGEKQLPILVDFSGSDWCGWCKVMEENVFTQPEWTTYATSNLVMVLIDFPNDKSLVPEKYVERNEALKNEYGVRGYPTFVVLDSDGSTELGRLGSGREKTPESFRTELEALFRFRPAAVAKYLESLNPEDRKSYQALIDGLAEQKRALKESEKAAAEARNTIGKLTQEIEETEEKMLEFRVAQRGEDELRQFRQLQAQLEESRQKLNDWMGSKPERNEESMKKYQAMQSEIQEIENKISEY